MSDNPIISIFSNAIYILIAAVVAVLLYLLGVTLAAVSLEYITLPTESFTAIGYSGGSGIGSWILSISDHIFRIMLMAVAFSIPASMASYLFKQVDFAFLSIALQIGFGILYMRAMWLFFTNKENYSPDEMPTIDVVFILIVFLLFLIVSIISNSDGTKWTAFITSGSAILAMVVCLVIQVIALAIAVYAHVISTLLDAWTYVDMTAGSEWNLLHIILSLFSHFHNILFFGGVAIGGLYCCYRVILRIVTDKRTAVILQSAIALWSLEFLLYAVTDKKSMDAAMFDTFDFSILIGMFALISIAALLGLFESLDED